MTHVRRSVNASFNFQSVLGLGMLELGICTSLALFGILIVQVYLYYLRHADSRLTRLLVGLVLFLETCQTAASVQALFQWTVLLENDNNKPASLPGVIVCVALDAIVALLVQSYFIHRIHTFTANTSLTLLLITLAFMRFACAITLSIESFLLLHLEPVHFAVQDRFPWLISVPFATGAGVDALIAAALCWYLWAWKKDEVPTMHT
uniref:Uncharacterized protein n=1 Tax=Mycena chlorophos TaxID=658473 RepID=A0ABQ0LZI9_MYCCL|nr:predicted protein [Mycena chlorophos]